MATIIINEFLTFVQNKIDVLDEISITQICATNFSEIEIETGKNVLFESCGSGQRNVQRKGDDKKKKNIKDVIRLLKEVDPDMQPIFVAKDLNRLPPVTFDYIDVTRLLKEITALRAEVTDLQLKVTEEVTDLRNSLNSSAEKITSRSNAEINKSETPPPVIVPLSTQELSEGDDIVYTPTYRDIAKDGRMQQAKMICKRRVHTNENRVQERTTHDSTNLRNTSNNDEEEFKVVSYKKPRKQQNLRGTLLTSSKIQAAQSHCAIYVSRINKSVTEVDIREHIKEMGQECIGIDMLKQKRETNFNSFKVTILSSKIETFLDTGFWPVGVVYRRFRERSN
ncbi:hypothetical protein K1T71_010479 [Dendrolimus kikuchii]|uniref:Uncharacterized protein n=1 Tax=Dendrolimus kikuchii TaxID=765133 RepID=A0ACC1CRL9_9NEOP|nr:hypothetical protein K1T71_010479 [Dendrolimus kikuchii]